MNILKELREEAMLQPDPHLQGELKKTANWIQESCKNLSIDALDFHLITLNSQWAHGLRLLMLSKTKRAPTGGGGAVTPHESAQHTEHEPVRKAA